MKRLSIILLASFALLTTNCASLLEAKLLPPTFKFNHYKVRDITTEQAVLEIIVDVNNPNSFTIEGMLVDYDLSLEGREFLQGDGINLDLISQGQSELILPITIQYSSLIPVMKGIGFSLLEKEPTIDIKTDLLFHGQVAVPAALGLKLKTNVNQAQTFQADIPIPKEAIKNKAAELLDIFLN
ncbi:hypothetical protein [Marinicellulosiphila megalodicopiae]|uniref:hypothetical protein n=1 Tax=Marinicellulosiphila megalodicopiae TaxID=2724896 RepID=UPI003BB20561